jgi:hypothetical protein
MARPTTNSAAISRWDSDLRLLAWLATCVSVFSFLYYYRRGEVLLYGDAIAHINIARRVFDSKTPGLLQLGTVWLPLPHLLTVPFLISNEMWRRGAGGSIPSMVAYAFGVLGMFRLVRAAFSRGVQPDTTVRVAAWSAALVYAANPNLMYMQATAMGEALYLTFFVWSIVYFCEFDGGNEKALTKCAACLAAGCLTRYDGWFLATAMTVTLVLRWFVNHPVHIPDRDLCRPRSAIVKFVLIVVSAPALWLAYNAIVYRNPLEFENGRYSAKAIERKTQSTGNPGHPGRGNLVVAGMYFVKSGEMNMAENTWLQRLWVLALSAALIGFGISGSSEPALGPPRAWLVILVLLLPVPFYALSVAYGGVPIFVPAWWPYSYYNVRYGLQLLPAFAFSLAGIIFLVLRLVPYARLRRVLVLCSFALVIGSYATIWQATPASLKEAQVNMRTRNQLEHRLAEWFRQLPPESTLLMYLGDHVGALEVADIPLRRVINEGNHRVWKQPSDPEGLWERALANPAGYADYVVAFEGDPVWQAVQGKHLRALLEMHVTGQARVVLFRAR